MAKELATKYDPSEFEDKIYDFWQENKYFHAEPDETKTPYTIVIPPPTSPGSSTWGTRSTIPCRTSSSAITG